MNGICAVKKGAECDYAASSETNLNSCYVLARASVIFLRQELVSSAFL